MSPEAEALYAAALSLSAEEREWLGNEIFRSIDNHPDLAPTPEQMAVIERRIREIDEGTVKTIPAEEAFRSILKRLGKHGDSDR